jgi:hypothetical protein
MPTEAGMTTFILLVVAAFLLIMALTPNAETRHQSDVYTKINEDEQNSPSE